jgi:hypothetical protein
MRFSLLQFVALLLLTGACSFENDYTPASHLSIERQGLLMSRIIRYMARTPDGVTEEDRMLREHDEHYNEQKSLHRLDGLYTSDNTHYFLVSRIAPSLVEKRVAIGGKLTVDENFQISYYEEVFRTWKMVPDTLAKRSLFLFDKMVRGEDLLPYCSSNSGNTDYIEFPDERTYFDSERRIWRSR